MALKRNKSTQPLDSPDRGLQALLDFTQDRGWTNASTVRALDRQLIAAASSGMLGTVSDLAPSERATLADQVRVGLEAFTTTGHWSPPINSKLVVNDIVVWNPAAQGFNAAPGLRLDISGPWPTTFWITVGQLIAAAGSRLRRCPQCARVFVRAGRGEYCSTACAGRYRAAQHYQRHRDRILDRRHERYAARVHQQQPRAKVQKRSGRQK